MVPGIEYQVCQQGRGTKRRLLYLAYSTDTTAEHKRVQAQERFAAKCGWRARRFRSGKNTVCLMLGAGGQT